MSRALTTFSAVLPFLFLLLTVPALSEKPENHFRKTRWGMTAEEVKASEGSALVADTAKSIIYSTKVAGLKTHILYSFIDDKLVKASYIFEEEHMNATNYIRDYERIKSIVTRKYGKPFMDEVIWKNDLYKDNPFRHGLAVTTGDLEYISKWTISDTEIELGLFGNNFKAHLVAYYGSVKYKDVVEGKEKKEQESDF